MDKGDDDKRSGQVQEGKGRLREAVGDLTGNKDQQAQGQAEQGKGKLDQTKGDLKNAVDDLTG